MPEPILNIQGLKAFYGDFQALYGVDMYIEPGEVLAIIGANGAGKTTLMRSVTGLLSNGPGQIHFQGNDISQLRADEVAMQGLAMVPEGRQLFPSLSVKENLRMGCFLRAHRKAYRERLDYVYDLFPILKEKSRQMAGDLSV